MLVLGRLVSGGAILVVLAAGLAGARASAAREAAFPSPPAGATVYSRQLGNDALALAVVARPDRTVLVQASVLGRQGNGVRDLRIVFTMGATSKTARRCGAGCYRATFAPAPAPRAVDVAIENRTKRPWHVVLPSRWPPRDGHALVGRAARAWRALRSLSFDERLASGIDIAVVSTWRVQAPNRVAYQVRDGWAGIVIGARRWDRAPGATEWKASPQTPLHQPVPPWVEVTDAHILGTVTARGRSALRASFFDPASRAWFTLVVDPRTNRTLDLRMVTNAHFMHDVFRAFDSTRPIVPPH